MNLWDKLYHVASGYHFFSEYGTVWFTGIISESDYQLVKPETCVLEYEGKFLLYKGMLERKQEGENQWIIPNTTTNPEPVFYCNSGYIAWQNGSEAKGKIDPYEVSCLKVSEDYQKVSEDELNKLTLKAREDLSKVSEDELTKLLSPMAKGKLEQQWTQSTNPTGDMVINSILTILFWGTLIAVYIWSRLPESSYEYEDFSEDEELALEEQEIIQEKNKQIQPPLAQ